MAQEVEIPQTVVWTVTVVVLLAILLPQMIRILREYERAVVFRLGKFLKVKGPGFIILIPFIDRIERVDLRVLTINVERQEIITRDNVTVHVDAIIFFRVVNAEHAIIQVEQYHEATTWLAQATLRSIVGQVELDELLAERETVNKKIQDIIDRHTDPWGIKVVSVEVRDVVLPDNMKRVMARQAEVERDRRAKVIHAQGEFQAAAKLVEAAKMMADHPIALQLRYLQTMTEVSEEQNSTFALIPFPMEFLEGFKVLGDSLGPKRSGKSAAKGEPEEARRKREQALAEAEEELKRLEEETDEGEEEEAEG
jgi:regulator of protease activity HflC (stomatin/prohibitin superfamily)